MTSASTAPHVYDNLDGFHETRLVFRPSYLTGAPTNQYSPQASFLPTRATVHLEGQNVLYADAHVKWVKLEALYKQACPEYPTVTSCTTRALTPHSVGDHASSTWERFQVLEA